MRILPSSHRMSHRWDLEQSSMLLLFPAWVFISLLLFPLVSHMKTGISKCSPTPLLPCPTRQFKVSDSEVNGFLSPLTLFSLLLAISGSKPLVFATQFINLEGIHGILSQQPESCQTRELRALKPFTVFCPLFLNPPARSLCWLNIGFDSDLNPCESFTKGLRDCRTKS